MGDLGWLSTVLAFDRAQTVFHQLYAETVRLNGVTYHKAVVKLAYLASHKLN